MRCNCLLRWACGRKNLDVKFGMGRWCPFGMINVMTSVPRLKKKDKCQSSRSWWFQVIIKVILGWSRSWIASSCVACGLRRMWVFRSETEPQHRSHGTAPAIFECFGDRTSIIFYTGVRFEYFNIEFHMILILIEDTFYLLLVPTLEVLNHPYSTSFAQRCTANHIKPWSHPETLVPVRPKALIRLITLKSHDMGINMW